MKIKIAMMSCLMTFGLGVAVDAAAQWDPRSPIRWGHSMDLSIKSVWWYDTHWDTEYFDTYVARVYQTRFSLDFNAFWPRAAVYLQKTQTPPPHERERGDMVGYFDSNPPWTCLEVLPNLWYDQEPTEVCSRIKENENGVKQILFVPMLEPRIADCRTITVKQWDGTRMVEPDPPVSAKWVDADSIKGIGQHPAGFKLSIIRSDIEWVDRGPPLGEQPVIGFHQADYEIIFGNVPLPNGSGPLKNGRCFLREDSLN